MGVEQPFLYDQQSRFSFTGSNAKAFNPRAVTEASWTPQAQRPKAAGPLINAKELNRHPDSYFIVPYGNLNWKPMSPHTKTKVKWLRTIQLLLRISALLGAAGLLFCVICVKPTGNNLDWIIRVPAGIAILHTVYAIYHLLRSSKERTPASTGSYMIFAAIIDAGLLPFFAYSAMVSHQQYTLPFGIDGHWATLFGDDVFTLKIILATFLLSTTDEALHLVSLCISVYLAVVFRKIAQLPPDMNPLEDNLTTRHKRNKSSMTVSTAEARSNRDSQASAPLVPPPRKVPFIHTRNESSSNVTEKPYRMTPSNRGSVADLPQPVHHNRNESHHYITPGTSDIYFQEGSQRSPVVDFAPPLPPKENARKAMPRYSFEDDVSDKENTVDEDDDNWVTYPSPTQSPPPHGPPELQYLNETSGRGKDLLDPATNSKYDFRNRSPRPLQMNPPTPDSYALKPTAAEYRALLPTSGNSSAMNWEEERYQEEDLKPQPLQTGSVASKARYFGNLRNSIKRNKRVTSSGFDNGQQGFVRAREVSGKAAEEGRRGYLY